TVVLSDQLQSSTNELGDLITSSAEAIRAQLSDVETTLAAELSSVQAALSSLSSVQAALSDELSRIDSALGDQMSSIQALSEQLSSNDASLSELLTLSTNLSERLDAVDDLVAGLPADFEETIIAAIPASVGGLSTLLLLILALTAINLLVAVVVAYTVLRERK
ncbi:MAG: hypothetical protein ACE5KH_06025, partial [Candidatus Geothermarchaeales archaeon]